MTVFLVSDTGPPLYVREMSVTNTTVKLMWSPSNELGTPTVSYCCHGTTSFL